MPKYYEGESVINAFTATTNQSATWARGVLSRTKEADVAPVIHAHWIHTGEYLTNSDGKRLMKLSDLYVCHRCNRVEGAPEPYCNCGAKMDGEIEEDV